MLDDGSETVLTSAGAVRGVGTSTGMRFRAIPYAAPPIGSNRFAPPRPVEPWSGIRNAVNAGPTAPQATTYGRISDLVPNTTVPGDDYLHLDVWTPNTSGAAPVIVFVHGGAFAFGSNAIGGYDGSTFARDGVVMVTINYRLGADGFLWFGEGVPNLGLLDQVAALEWVRDEIAAFGGDPARVTLMGQSAGAMSIAALMAMPAAKGLFRRAIMQSGAGHHAISPSAAQHVGKRLAKALGVEPTRRAVADVPVADLVAAQTTVSQQMEGSPFRRIWGDVATNLMAFEPVVDGAILPVLPIDAIRSGAGAEIDVLVGYTTDEAKMFFLDLPGRALRTRLTGLVLGRLFGLTRRDVAFYGNRAGGVERDWEAMTALLTDATYRIPALRLAEAHGQAHVYRFGWSSPARNGRLGAAHITDLPFVFDAVDHPDYQGLVRGDSSEETARLAHRMHAAWVAFAKSGDPGWPVYGPEQRAEMGFGGMDGLVEDYDPEARAFWDGRR